MSHPLVVPLGAADGPVGAYRDAGGVVEFVLVAREGDDAATQHRRAAEAALDEIAARWESWASARSAEKGLDRATFRAIRTEPSRAVGREIDVSAFVGRAYSWDQHAIVSMWEHRGGSGSKPSAGAFMTDGYAEAFSDPPYPMTADLERINDLFGAINRQLLDGLSASLTVWSWSTDWSTWFEDGHEWWGAFLWTVERDTLPWITAIAASATD